LDKCYNLLAQKAADKNREVINLESFDGVIFHSPYCKLVQKSLARMLLNDVIRMSEEDISARFPGLASLRNTKLEESYFDRDVEKQIMTASKDTFDRKTKSSIYVANQVGNMYTASVYGGLVSYLISKPINELLGNRLCLFSYGSGLQASMYTIRISSESSDKLADLLAGISDVRKRIDSRLEFVPEKFADMMLLREKTHHKAPYKPIGRIEDLRPGTYYIEAVDDMHRREYLRSSGASNNLNNH
jgi:hydroxymethylglutaryl-CoA synthase